MASENKVILIGRVGRDPEIRHTASGTPVATWSLAVGERRKDQSGTVRETTTWLDCQAWSKLAEVVEQYVKKGDQLYIVGKIEVNEYEGKDGAKRRQTRIVVQNLQMLGSPKKGEAQEKPKTQDPDFPPEDDDFPL